MCSSDICRTHPEHIAPIAMCSTLNTHRTQLSYSACRLIFYSTEMTVFSLKCANLFHFEHIKGIFGWVSDVPCTTYSRTTRTMLRRDTVTEWVHRQVCCVKISSIAVKAYKHKQEIAFRPVSNSFLLYRIFSNLRTMQRFQTKLVQLGQLIWEIVLLFFWPKAWHVFPLPIHHPWTFFFCLFRICISRFILF